MSNRAEEQADTFDTPDEFDAPGEEAQPKRVDPARPEAKRGRYTLPNPANGKSKSWQRVTNFIKLVDDTYHLELWKQRNVAKGVAMRPDLVEAIQPLDVKQDKERLNRIVERAQDIAGAYKMSSEGTRCTPAPSWPTTRAGPWPPSRRSTSRACSCTWTRCGSTG